MVIPSAHRLSAFRTLSLAMILAGSTIARADAPQLADARIAIDEVRYDDAQRLLIAALEVGGNSPAAVREIYKLLGASAVAMGQGDEAQKYYRAWIALDAKAALDTGASPKLREPFDAAKSFITANGPLDVVAEYISDDEIRIRVLTDVLALARTVRVEGKSADIVDRGALLTGTTSSLVVVLDRYGNTLVQLQARGGPPKTKRTGTTSEEYAAPMVDTSASKRHLGTSFYALAIPTGLLLATGIGFGTASIVYNSKVRIAIDDSGANYYTDVVDQQKKVTLFWKLSAVIGGAGLVLAIPTAILYLRSRTTVVMPYVDGNGAGAAITARF